MLPKMSWFWTRLERIAGQCFPTQVKHEDKRLELSRPILTGLPISGYRHKNAKYSCSPFKITQKLKLSYFILPGSFLFEQKYNVCVCAYTIIHHLEFPSSFSCFLLNEKIVWIDKTNILSYLAQLLLNFPKNWK